MINDFEQQVKDADNRSDSRKRVSLDNVFDAERMIQSYQEYVSQLDKLNFKTGVRQIDEKIRGVAGGEVLVILARAGLFKTALLQNLLLGFTQISPLGAVFFSLEMPIPNVTERFSQIISGFSGYEIESAYRERESYLENLQAKFIKSMRGLYTVPSRVSLNDIPEYISLIEEKYKGKIGVVGIDYLGLIDAKGPNQYEIISRIARETKTMAKEINLPVVVLCQSSRAGGDGSAEIEVSMARDSGAIEEGCDFMLGLFQSENGVDSENNPRFDLICKILKNRKGPKNAKFKLDLNPRNFQLGPEATKWTPEKKQRGYGD
jgi:replicative DNA helicase